MKIDGSINPVTASFIHDAIEKAKNEKAVCLLIHLNTPGGLLKSTRVIVSDMLDSPVPVVVYVSPAGAHAGSAGVFITLAANIAAMTPGTNIGAAHPVALQAAMDSTMNEKATNDAAAFIRAIAQKRNRNLQWAENAVRRSYSYSEKEALEDSVIDLIANNELDLLNKIDGKQIELGSEKVTLRTKNVSNIKPGPFIPPPPINRPRRKITPRSYSRNMRMALARISTTNKIMTTVATGNCSITMYLCFSY